DAVILDLEDSIPPDQKEAARGAVRALLRSERFLEHQLLVRVNGFASGLTADDLAAVLSPRLAGLVLPKVEHPDELREANRLLGIVEMQAGLEIGSTRLIPTVETVRGILHAVALASSGRRALALCFGYDDFAL